MGVEFSAVAMPISAPGADGVLKALEALDRRAQSMAKHVDEAMGKLQERTEKAIPPVDRLAASLRRMQAARATEQFTAASTRAHMSTGRLSQELLTMTKNLLGVNPAVAQVTGALGKMAIGDMAMIGILAGIAAIGFAYEKLTEKARAAAEETRKFRKEIGDLANAGELAQLRERARTLLYGTPFDEKGNLNEVSKRVAGAFKGSLADMEAEFAELQASIPRGAAMASGETARRWNELVPKLDRAREAFRMLQEAANNVASQPAGNAGLLPGVTSSAKGPVATKNDADAAEKALKDAAARRAKALNSVLDGLRKVGDEAAERNLKRQKERDQKAEEQAKRHAQAIIQISQRMAADTAAIIGRTISGALQGGLGGGLTALKDAVLDRLGQTLIGIGETMVAASPLLKAAAQALLTLSGGGSLAAGLGLIALGSTLTAVAGGRGAGGGGSYSAGASTGGNLGAQIVSVAPAAGPNMAGVSPAKSVIVHATFIGKHDPRAGRELLEMIEYHQSTRRT